ncbi:MAG: ABC transporter permease [Clostridia bacterium]|nr:ABC transporter permease [Clostridia bacterium]
MLSVRKLPLRNLRGYASRSAAIILFAALTSAAVFGGLLLTGAVRGGLETVRARLGADIMVTPESAKNEFDAQTALIKAEPGYFYMDSDVLEQIRSIEGVAAASPQLFLASAKAGCCSARLQLIAFDPATDFTVQPWIADTGTTREMGLMDVIIGSSVSWPSADNAVIRFYDSECSVIGQFAPTGSALDSAVYMNFDTCRALIDACRSMGLFKYADFDGDRSVSSVLVRVKEGYDAESVASEIRARIGGVSAVTAAGMLSGIADGLRHVSSAVKALMLAFWLPGLFMAVLFFAFMINERKKEFAALRAMGADRRILSRIAVTEALAANLAGGLIGIIVSGVLLCAFGGLIAGRMNVTFVLPPLGKMLLTALAALLPAVLAAACSSLAALGIISRTDAALLLKEGE